MAIEQRVAYLAMLFLYWALMLSATAADKTAPPQITAGDSPPSLPTRGGTGVSEALVLTEIAVASDGAEFIEIHNPNSVAFDLSDVYLSDATFAPDGVYYYNLVTGARDDMGGGRGFGDFSARFPGGASIPAGGYQVISLAGSDEFSSAWGFLPDYELFEDGASADAVPDMREALTGSINDQGNLTDSGEFAVLFYWDGISDLVADLDYLVWGDQQEAVDKTGVAVDGPDAATDTSTYVSDTPITAQSVLGSSGPGVGLSFQRDDLAEGSESQASGNGFTGSDETSENLSETWCIDQATPGAPSDCPQPLPPLACGEPATRIHQVQGAGTFSPLVGDLVEIEGVVIGDFANGVPTELGGFFLQEEDSQADVDPLTSEGVFVLTNVLEVEPGDVARVRGRVEESFGATRISNVDGAIRCGTGFSVTSVPIVLPIGDPTELESVEGMAVSLPQSLTVTDTANLARFGEFTLSNGRLFKPTQTQMPGAAANAQQQANDRNRLVVDDGRIGTYVRPFPGGANEADPISAANPVRTGYTVTGLQGVMYFTFNNYKIEPTIPIAFDQTALPRPGVPGLADTPLRISAINLSNYFSTLDDAGPICGPASNQSCGGADTGAEFSRQNDKLVAAVLAMGADIVALAEIENNDSASLQALVGGLNGATTPGSWAFVDAGSIGSNAIKNGFIFTPSTVAEIGVPAVLDSSIDARFDSSLNRPALAQTFEHVASSERLTVIANHFKSRNCSGASGPDLDQGDGQGCYNATRASAAAALVDWMAADPTGSGDPDFLVLGDLNSYFMEDPIQQLLQSGGLESLGARYDDPNQTYSFEFQGEVGALDYLLASPSLALQVFDGTHWHINADELSEFDYNEEDLSAGIPKPDEFFSPEAYRASDHDPVLAALVPGPGIVDAEADQTLLRSDRQFVAADGAETAVITVQLVNRVGEPVAGVLVQLAATGNAALAQLSGITGSDGRFATTITNTSFEEVAVTAQYDVDASGIPATPIVNGAPQRVRFRDPAQYIFASGFE